MPLRLPNLAESSCSFFGTCGQAKTSGKKPPGSGNGKDAWMVARTQSGNKTVIMRAGFGGQSGTHCHLDLATSDVFKNQRKPTITNKKADIEAAFEKIKGASVDVEIEGIFLLPLGKLPPVIQLTVDMFGSEQDGVSIKMTGGKLSITGTPVYAITWSADDDDDKDVTIKLEARVEVMADDSYLTGMFSMLNAAFQSFISSGVPNAQ